MRLAAGLPAEEDPDHEEAAEDQPDRGRETGPRRPAGLGLDPAPLGRAKHAEHEQAEAERREHRTDVVQLGALLDRRIGDAARQKQDREHDHDLSCEHPAPREVRRAEAPDQRPDRDRDGARSRDEPVGRGPALGREVPGNEGDDGRQDQRRADALEERPAEEQHGQALRDRRRERAAAVDHAADREGALPTDYRPDLRAGDHQHRHHERVGGDRSLDAGHRRAHVLRDRRDRDVHHRAVERHQELARGEREQHQGRAGGACEVRGPGLVTGAILSGWAQRKYASLSQSQLSRRSRVPVSGSARFERAMSGSNSRSSNAVASSALRAIIMISESR